MEMSNPFTSSFDTPSNFANGLPYSPSTPNPPPTFNPPPTTPPTLPLTPNPAPTPPTLSSGQFVPSLFLTTTSTHYLSCTSIPCSISTHIHHTNSPLHPHPVTHTDSPIHQHCHPSTYLHQLIANTPIPTQALSPLTSIMPFFIHTLWSLMFRTSLHPPHLSSTHTPFLSEYKFQQRL